MEMSNKALIFSGLGLAVTWWFCASWPTTQRLGPTACGSDWRQWQDNAELVNNYDGMGGVEYDCMEAANSQAKYGDPEWPWRAFSTFLKGDDYPRTGVVTVKEHDAR